MNHQLKNIINKFLQIKILMYVPRVLSYLFRRNRRYRMNYLCQRNFTLSSKIVRFKFLRINFLNIFTDKKKVPISNFLNFHTSSAYNAKSFQEKENEYAHSIMEGNDTYALSISKHPLVRKKRNFKISNVDAFNEFAEVSSENYLKILSIENDKLTKLISSVSSMLPYGSDEDILKVLYHLCLWPPTAKTYTSNFKTIWNSLDEECVKRLKNWEINFQLLVADYWFHLRLNRISKYNRNLIINLLENVDTLTDSQVVQLMFYINLQRKIPQDVLFRLENKLEKVITSVSLEEMGVICLGFFKTESKIRNFKIIQNMIYHFMNNVSNANTVTIAAVLKFFRKCLHHPFLDMYINLMHGCVSHVSSWDVPTSVHLALLSSECNVYHPLLLNTVAQKLATEIKNTRLKDCAKLLQCSSQFNHYDEKFHEILKKEVHSETRQEEIRAYPRDVLHLSLFYAYMGHFDYSLLRTILNPIFMQSCCEKFPEMNHVFAELDYFIEIECKDYSGPRLEKNKLKVLSKRRGNLPSSLNTNMQIRLTSEIYQCLRDIMCSDDNILIKHILPHIFSPDIIVRLHKSKGKSLAELYNIFPAENILVPPQEEMWACFVVGGTFSFACRSKHVAGITAMKLRQLKILGYKVVFVPFYNVSPNRTHRTNYIKEQLHSLGFDNLKSNVSEELKITSYTS